MSGATNGVALLGRILAQVAAGEPMSAADLARTLGAGRTTTFQVLRDLEAAGLVERDARGLVQPGAGSADLGFARFGLSGLAEQVHALLPVLRDETEAQVALVLRRDGVDIVLAQRSPAAFDADTAPGGAVLETPLSGPAHGAWLRLVFSAGTRPQNRKAAQGALEAVAAALSRPAEPAHLGDEPP